VRPYLWMAQQYELSQECMTGGCIIIQWMLLA
jgi:hypothetical protein